MQQHAAGWGNTSQQDAAQCRSAAQCCKRATSVHQGSALGQQAAAVQPPMHAAPPLPPLPPPLPPPTTRCHRSCPTPHRSAPRRTAGGPPGSRGQRSSGLLQCCCQKTACSPGPCLPGCICAPAVSVAVGRSVAALRCSVSATTPSHEAMTKALPCRLGPGWGPAHAVCRASPFASCSTRSSACKTTPATSISLLCAAAGGVWQHGAWLACC